MQSVSVNDGGATGRTEVLANAEADLLGGSCSVSGSGSGSNGEAREESKPAKVTNINMDAALLHAVTDLVRLCCFVLFCVVLFCFVLFCFVLFCFVLFCFVLFCFVLFVLFVCFVCSFVVLFVLFVCFVFVLLCLVLICLVLFCFVFTMVVSTLSGSKLRMILHSICLLSKFYNRFSTTLLLPI